MLPSDLKVILAFFAGFGLDDVWDDDDLLLLLPVLLELELFPLELLLFVLLPKTLL